MNLQEHLPGIQNLLKYLFIGSSDEDDRNILDGRVDIVYGSPEALVGNPEWRESMRSSLEVSTIVIDEFHTIATWQVHIFSSCILIHNIASVQLVGLWCTCK